MKAVYHPSALTDDALAVLFECLDTTYDRLHGADQGKAARYLWMCAGMREITNAHADMVRYQKANGGDKFKRHNTYWP
jgi:hypothetical protein